MPKRQHDTDDDDPFDERGLLKDKRSVRVPMMMRDGADGLTDLRRSVRDHFAPARVVDAFGDAGAGLCIVQGHDISSLVRGPSTTPSS